MVAYSFAPMFCDQVARLVKRHTIRADRKRHARPGECLQLFGGLRTKWCRKLVDPDPICLSVVPVAIQTSPLISAFLASIAIDGVLLDRDDIEAFAAADGFAPSEIGLVRTHRTYAGQPATARSHMGEFWAHHHGFGRFDGVLIRWEPA